MNIITPVLVLLGLPTEDKPRGAKFNIQEEKAVRKAAELMGLQFGTASEAEAVALTKDLPQGRIFDSGRALLPILKKELHEKLSSAIKLESFAKPAAPSAPQATNPWAAIKPNDIVLAEDVGQGWFEAIVLAVDMKKQKLSLRWRDYKLPNFNRKLTAVALLQKTKG